MVVDVKKMPIIKPMPLAKISPVKSARLTNTLVRDYLHSLRKQNWSSTTKEGVREVVKKMNSLTNKTNLFSKYVEIKDEHYDVKYSDFTLNGKHYFKIYCTKNKCRFQINLT